MEKKITAYSFFIFMIFLVSMELWIGWGGQKSNMLALFGGLAIACKFLSKVPFEFSRRNILLCIAFYWGYLMLHPQMGTREYFTQIPPQLVPIICIVCVGDIYKERILQNITKWYAVLMISSMVVYALTFIVHIPGLGQMQYSDVSQYGTFTNYILFVKEYGGYADFRFNGPFLEPGYVGMMGAFLLFANHFNFQNKHVIVILVSTLVSFSLAGWALAIIGYVLLMYNDGKIKFSRVIAFLVVFILFVNVGKYYNGGDNIINNEILSRLQYDSEKGFTGNNRNVETMTIFFMEMWSNPDVLWHGYPETAFYGLSDWETIGAGLDRFMVFHGLLGVFYVFLFYVIAILYDKDKKFAIIFFLFVLASFWQRTYAQWFSWIICFYYASIIQDSKQNQITSDNINLK